MKTTTIGFNKFVRDSLAVIALLASVGAQAFAADIELGIEYQSFYQDDTANNADYNDNQHSYFSLAYENGSNNGNWQFEFDSYLAYDQRDKQRTRGDFRTLALSYYQDNYDITLGVMTEFWGVTESRHLVDILNTTSVADNIDEEFKLGQPMLKWQSHQNWGNLQLFWLPIFRERLFPSAGSRLTPAFEIDDDLTAYASGAEKTHQDFALRYAHTMGRWDIGLAHFSGTSREPLLQPVLNAGGVIVLSPYYEQIQQTSIDLQMTSDGLLLKLEALHRRGNQQGSYNALVSGFEYTQIGLLGSAMDLGYIAEYLYDERGERATTPFQDDIFLGLRLVANNIAQTSLLVGAYHALDTRGQALRLELESRIRDDLVLSLEGQVFRNLEPNDLLYAFRNDDYLRMTLRFYF